MLTEVIQYSEHVLHQPAFILYLDAKSVFDNVLKQLLIRNLYFCGTSGKELLYINNRLESRKTFAEWEKKLMGPICDELGVEQGNVNSGDFYKIYAKSQLQMAQYSNLGVELARDIVVSGIGQADDTLLLSNNLHSLQNLLQLSLYYCTKFNVELSPEKTKLQVIAPKRLSKEVEYLKEFSPVQINGIKLKFHDSAEHVGIVRAVSGNLPNLVSRISSQKKSCRCCPPKWLSKTPSCQSCSTIKSLGNIWDSSSPVRPLLTCPQENRTKPHQPSQTGDSQKHASSPAKHSPSSYLLSCWLPTWRGSDPSETACSTWHDQ